MEYGKNEDNGATLNMKNFLILFFFCFVANAQNEIFYNDLKVGREVESNISLMANIGRVNNPQFRYNVTENEWQYSDNGVNFTSLNDLIVDISSKADINSPVFTGAPEAPTVSQGDDSNKIATTKYVDTAIQSANIPDATTTVKGKIKLSGDLSGTADAPTVPRLSGLDTRLDATDLNLSNTESRVSSIESTMLTSVKVNSNDSSSNIEVYPSLSVNDRGGKIASIETANTNILVNSKGLNKTPNLGWAFRNLSGGLGCSLSISAGSSVTSIGVGEFAVSCSGAGEGEIFQTRNGVSSDLDHYASALLKRPTSGFSYLGMALYSGSTVSLLNKASFEDGYDFARLEGTVKAVSPATSITYAIRISKTDPDPSNVSFIRPYLGVSDAPSWTMKTVKNYENMKSYGPIQITATTTNPTKGAIETDTFNCIPDGEIWDCDYLYVQSAPGTAGNGGYIFNLPPSVEIDDSVFKTANQTITGGYSAAQFFVTDFYRSNIGRAGVIHQANSGSTNNGIAFATSSKTFQILVYNNLNTGSVVNSAQYQLSNTGKTGLWAKLRFKGKGLRSTVDIASQAMKYQDYKNHLVFSFSLNSAGGITKNSTKGVVTSNASVTSTSTYTVSFNGLSSAPECVLTPLHSTDFVAVRKVSDTTNTQLSFRTVASSNNPVPSSMDIICVKTGADELEAYRSIALMAIKESNIYYDRDEFHTDERDTGRKYDGRNVFKRCHKLSSDLSETTPFFTISGSVANVIGAIKRNNTWEVKMWMAGSISQMWYLAINTSTNVLQINKLGSPPDLQAGTTFCIEYTKL